MKFKLFTVMLLSSNLAYAGDTLTGVDVQPRSSSCVRNNPCIVASSHFASVVNSSGQPTTIYVKYSICPQNEDCRHDQYKVTVGNGQWQDNKMMTLMAKYHYNGDFYLDAETTVYDARHNVLNTVKKRGKIQVHG